MKTIIKSLTKIFAKKIKPTGFVYSMDNNKGWGSSINWDDFEKRKIYGHFSNPRLQIGDCLLSVMNNGQTYKFIISKIEYCRDPRDMFFGEVHDVGYTEDTEEIKMKHSGFLM